MKFSFQGVIERWLYIFLVVVIVIFYLGICIALVYLSDKKNNQEFEQQKIEKKNELIEKEKELIKSGYIKPTFKELTKEQIDDIHSRGKITPAEMVKEWEGMDLCAPGDSIGSASWRCRKFHHNCHDCLVDYANEYNEYTSLFKILKECKPYKI